MADRRYFPRTRVFKGAKAIVAGGAAVSCVVRDLSYQGAGLQLASTADLPARFDLTFDTGRKVRDCRIVWRELTNVGISFGQQT